MPPGAGRRRRSWPRRPPPALTACCDILGADGRDLREERYMAATQEAMAIAGSIAELRHAIHAEPEVGLQLPLTQRKILAALADLPLEITTGTALTSVTAVLRGGAAQGDGAG